MSVAYCVTGKILQNVLILVKEVRELRGPNKVLAVITQGQAEQYTQTLD